MPDDTPQSNPDNLAAELAQALTMLFSVATDRRATLPWRELYTDMALNGARAALDKAAAAGLLMNDDMSLAPVPAKAGMFEQGNRLY